ncbi:MAG: S8 family serine peptidase, partial [Planctomycetota bacterium]
MLPYTNRSPGRKAGLAARRMVMAVLLAATAPVTGDDVRWKRGADGSTPPVGALPAGDGPVLTAVQLRAAVPRGTVDHLIVQFSTSPTVEERQRLRDAGLELQAPLGAHAFFARIDGERFDLGQVASVGRLRGAAPIDPSIKKHPAIRANRWPDWTVVEREHGQANRVAAFVLMHPDVSREHARELAEAMGATVRTILHTINALVLEGAPAIIDQLAARHEVQWIEPAPPRWSTMNAENRAAVQADVVQAPPDGLSGAGVVVMVYDSGSALQGHLDFGGRLQARDDDVLSNHTTHVCGTIGGSGQASGGAHRGMAPGVTVESYGYHFGGDAVFLYQNPGDMENDYTEAIQQHGAVLANNSIGTNTAMNGFPCEIMGDYGITSAVIDAMVRGNLGAPMRIIWAAGNERDSPNCGQDYATTAPPAGAKNHLTVGAVDAVDRSVTSFTSWGPVDDGRLKPDVCAPGCQSGGDHGVTSTASNGGYGLLCGTSMASATVTGLAALLIEDCREQFPGRHDPLPSTLKTLFVHAALDLEAPGPDYKTGYGLVQVQDTIDLSRSGNFVESQLDHGDEVHFRVVVEEPVGTLKVTLAWDDPPGTPNVDPALVNDLDLLVTGPGGSHHPWSLDPEAPWLAATRDGPDRVNNLEQVLVTDPQPGVYTVSVVGFDVPQGPQTFSLAAGPQLVTTVIDPLGEPPLRLSPGTPRTIRVRVTSQGESLVADGVRLHSRIDGGAWTSTVMQPSVDGPFEAELPAIGCGSSLAYTFSAEGSISGLHTLPVGAPDSAYHADAGDTVVVFGDDFEDDRGWTVLSSKQLVTGAWERGVPAGSGTRGDPAADADGSGQCFLTHNAPGNNDVDGGSTTLIS